MKHATFSAVLFLVACVGAATNPPQGPGTAFPCGYHGISCGGGMCCDDNSECGSGAAFSTCPAGYCCFVGDDMMGAHRASWQWRSR